MLGMLFNEKECKELDYVLRKELDEMLDLSDQRLDQNIRQAIANRYKTVFACMPGLPAERTLQICA